MLHRINLPACTQHLEWVVQLQGHLLRNLCDANLCAMSVTVDWVKAQRPDLGAKWTERFCGWSKEDKSILDRMQAVAALPSIDKQTLLTHYELNLRYPEAFDAALPPPPATTPLPDGLSADAASAYRNFFDLFYAPTFYRDKGYPIAAADLNGRAFTKDRYLEAYRASNPNMKVCPICDGSMDGAELDHWLAKKHLPELNCHPQNLVEICSYCNSRTNKGEKLALDARAADPFGNWFHPHLRSAVGQSEIKVEHGKPRLASDDPVVQRRLDTFSGLMNLTRRWKAEYHIQFKGIQQRVRNHRRRGTTFDENGLMSQLESWKTDAEAEQGIQPHKLLQTALLSLAMDRSSHAFHELLEYATTAA